MKNSDNSISPFGEKLQKYWDLRYLYFSKFDEGIQTDEEGLYSVTPEKVAEMQAKVIIGKTVLDGFCGIGGSTIGFARAGKKVTAVDINQERLNMARHNASIYGVEDNITFICDDILNVIKKVNADTINLDPPWGGPAYIELGRFLLKHFNPDANELLNVSIGRFNELMLRVPTIFDFTELEKFNTKYKVIDDVSDGRVISKTILFSAKN